MIVFHCKLCSSIGAGFITDGGKKAGCWWGQRESCVHPTQRVFLRTRHAQWSRGWNSRQDRVLYFCHYKFCF